MSQFKGPHKSYSSERSIDVKSRQMSTIKKIAVYDSRLQQDEPAYAVQKGALSVSVAPFQAIAANAAQMTFQVLVPSLNVFVDRKIQLSAGLNFTANLFYSGPRGLSMKGYQAAGACLASTTGNDNVITFVANTTINGTVGTLPLGTQIFCKVPAIGWPANVYVVQLATAANSYGLNVNVPVAANTTTFYYEAPLSYDVPDPVMGDQFSLAFDGGFSNAYQGEPFLPVGYCTAVSPKDLACAQFPLQTALTNMTATLNDCTVTTNGDTLREQLMLTSSQETLKQRTTPTGSDAYSWGRDDANSGSGNFSSYSVVNGYGDIPNGAFPTTWYSDATQSSPLSSVTSIVPTVPLGGTPNATGTYPFFPAGTAYSFGLSNSSGSTMAATQTGCGWYIAKTQASNVSGIINSSTVVVPFVNNQPVWTTGFPGGDLISYQTTAVTGGTTMLFGNPGFQVVSAAVGGGSQVLVLLKNVPPYCMIGARLYGSGGTAVVGVNTTQAGGVIPPANYLGFVCNLISGSLGCVGSVYNIASSTILSVAQCTSFSLSAGFLATQSPMPVFGAISVVEPLVISPLIWADSAEFQSVGLYGMTNMQFVLNFAPLGTCYAALNLPTSVPSSQLQSTLPWWVDDVTRPTQNTGNIIRSSNIRTIISDLAFGSSTNQYGPWTSPTLFAEFLTPGPDVTLPLVSTVPYWEFPRYTQTLTGSNFQGSQTLRTQTISLTSIPDMVMIYVKPATKAPSQLDQYIPISNVSVTFDNFSNLCSGFQQFNLYESAVAAGLDIDWHQWRGYTQGALSSLARSSASTSSTPVTTTAQYKQTGVTQLSGGPILLRMGHDITLSPGLAPGCLGNYSFQATVQTSNPYGFYDYLSAVTITVIAINTGFFETVRGQSAIRKTILNSADVEAATPETGTTKTHLHRMVGRGHYGRGFASHIGHALSKSSHLSRLAGRMAGGVAVGAKRFRGGPQPSGLE